MKLLTNNGGVGSARALIILADHMKLFMNKRTVPVPTGLPQVNVVKFPLRALLWGAPRDPLELWGKCVEISGERADLCGNSEEILRNCMDICQNYSLHQEGGFSNKMVHLVA